MKTTPDTRRSDGIHTLWLLLIGISARNSERFEPTQAESDEIQFSCLKTGLTAGDLSRLTDQAMRFAQIQGEIQTIGDPAPEFQSLGLDVRELTESKRKTALDFDRKIRTLEKRRQFLGGLITRQAALRQESESLQKQIAKFGNGGPES